jgi:soluble lytic murein transglycosylase-like protein
MLGRGVGRTGCIAVLAGLALVSPAAAGTFRFQDEAGTVHYTNTPPDNRYRQVRDLPEGRSSVPFAGRRSSPSAAIAPYSELIRAAAERHRVDRRLVEAVMTAESAGNPRAVSRKGAQGLMQLMPATAQALGVQDAFDPAANLDGGTRHLSDLIALYNGDVTKALAAYNAGAGAVSRHRGVPPYKETQEYVKKVMKRYRGGK